MEPVGNISSVFTLRPIGHQFPFVKTISSVMTSVSRGKRPMSCSIPLNENQTKSRTGPPLSYPHNCRRRVYFSILYTCSNRGKDRASLQSTSEIIKEVRFLVGATGTCLKKERKRPGIEEGVVVNLQDGKSAGEGWFGFRKGQQDLGGDESEGWSYFLDK